MDEEKHKTEVVVPDDQLSLAIGRRGQNVKLASQLTGWEIDIMTETEESERRQKETRERTELFKASLDVDDVIAHLLVAEGYGAVEDIADSRGRGPGRRRGLRRGDRHRAAAPRPRIYREARRRARHPPARSWASTRMCARSRASPCR